MSFWRFFKRRALRDLGPKHKSEPIDQYGGAKEQEEMRERIRRVQASLDILRAGTNLERRRAPR